MQIIPADWQNTIEQYIVTIKATDDRKKFLVKKFGGDVLCSHTGYSETYESHIQALTECRDFMTGCFGSVGGFNEFLKSDIKFQLADKGYEGDVLDSWQGTALRDDSHTAAHLALRAYEAWYKPAVAQIAQLSAQAKERTSLPAPGLQLCYFS